MTASFQSLFHIGKQFINVSPLPSVVPLVAGHHQVFAGEKCFYGLFAHLVQSLSIGFGLNGGGGRDGIGIQH